MHTPIHLKAILPLVLILSLMSGCSTKEVQHQNLPQANIPSAYKQTEDNFWWRCQFKIVWPEDTRLNWGMDLLLAHSVISPILENHHKDISYWRFHRRAARDSAGHQFSFIFYSNPETAASVYREIQQSSVLKQALERKLVERVRTGDPQNPTSPNIEDTSDPNWPPDIQKTWPLFIMGVSSLWLGLINESFHAEPEDHGKIELLLEKYREVDAQITNLWRNEGQHAFLHHLNAVFGYNPMFLRKMITF
jgi:hypothetical protein